MEVFRTFQNLYILGIALFGILSLVFAYGYIHFRRKKEELKRNLSKDTINKTVINPKDTNNSKSGSKSKVEQPLVAPSGSVNTLNPKITTQKYSAGKNTKPAIVLQEPNFEPRGKHGINILSHNIEEISKDVIYSFSANIPVNSSIKVKLFKITSDERAVWRMQLGNSVNWRWNNYYKGEQEFTLQHESGDLTLIFSDSGSAKMSISYNSQLIREKIISWK